MDRFASVIFCEDVRQEINGKTSLMGVFQSAIYLASFPAIIPKLCIVASAFSPVEKPMQTASFRGMLGEQELFHIPISAEMMKEGRAVSAHVPVARFDNIQVLAVVSPFQIEAPGVIRIEVIADGEEIPCPGLQALLPPEGLELIS